MAARNEDPILNSYMELTASYFQFLNDDTSRQVSRIRRSIYSSETVGLGNRDGYVRDIYYFYNPLREFVKESIVRPRGRQARLRKTPRTIYNAYLSQRPQIVESHAKILSNRRQYVKIPTALDADFANCITVFDIAGEHVELLDKALQGDEEALRIIYNTVLADRLAQKSAPYQFDVVSYVLRVRGSKEEGAGRESSLYRSISFLAAEARKLADSIRVSNVDKKFGAALEEYYTMLVGLFDPILVDLFSNKLRAFLVELRDELPSHVIAETTAMLLSQDQILRQFPEWKEFAAAAAEFYPDAEQIETHRKTISAIAQEAKANPIVASMEVSAAFDRLDEAAGETTTSLTVRLGTWRSLENFTKENIRKLIDIVRELSERATFGAAESRYLQFVEKLLPHLKLFIRMVDSLHWLEPVVTWMEEVLKKRK